MSKKKFSKNLDWTEFQALGDKNYEESREQNVSAQDNILQLGDQVRIYKEKKGRKGKTVTIVKGLTLTIDDLNLICKELKVKCGVGGQVEGLNIVLQGDQRDRILKVMLDRGYRDVKKAGA